MKYLTTLLLGLLSLTTNSDLSAQVSLNRKPIYPDGISLGCQTVAASGDSLSYSAFNRKISHEKLAVSLRTSREVQAKNLRVTPDSCVWFDAQTRQQQASTVKDIGEIALTDHGAGMWRGAGLGALAGTALFYAAGKASNVGEVDREQAFNLMMMSFGGALVGGGAIGAIQGVEHQYTIMPRKQVVMQVWDGSPCVLDAALVERIEDVRKK
jgi:hypothetical protein